MLNTQLIRAIKQVVREYALIDEPITKTVEELSKILSKDKWAAKLKLSEDAERRVKSFIPGDLETAPTKKKAATKRKPAAKKTKKTTKKKAQQV